MPRVVRCGLIQASCEWSPEKYSLAQIKQKMMAKHDDLIATAAKKKVQVLGLQELFYGPYFCAEQQTRWYESDRTCAERPDHRAHAKAREETSDGPRRAHLRSRDDRAFIFNTAAVIDADGRYLGKYRKHHIPHCHPGFWEKFYFTPGNAGYPVSKRVTPASAFTSATTAIFPKARAVLGLNGAEIVFNPSATVAGLSEYLWELEQPAHAVANQYFVAAINRVGLEAPWNIGEFYGKSYFCNPRGKIVAQASRDKDELLVAELDLDEIQKVRAHVAVLSRPPPRNLRRNHAHTRRIKFRSRRLNLLCQSAQQLTPLRRKT